MRDQGQMHGPSSDPVEYLKSRLREYDRKLEDLYRRVPHPPSAPAPVASGGCSEGFRFGFDHTRTSGATSVDFSTFFGSWSSSGVSITYSSFTSSDSLITIPAGIWTIGANWRYVPSVAVTTGRARLSIINDGSPNGYVNVTAETSLSELQDNFTVSGFEGYDTMSTVNYIDAEDTIYLTFSHSTNVSLRCVGEIWGVQHDGCSVSVDDE